MRSLDSIAVASLKTNVCTCSSVFNNFGGRERQKLLLFYTFRPQVAYFNSCSVQRLWQKWHHFGDKLNALAMPCTTAASFYSNHFVKFDIWSRNVWIQPLEFWLTWILNLPSNLLKVWKQDICDNFPMISLTGKAEVVLWKSGRSDSTQEKKTYPILTLGLWCLTNSKTFKMLGIFWFFLRTTHVVWQINLSELDPPSLC